MEPKQHINPETLRTAIILLAAVALIIGFFGLFRGSHGGTTNPFPAKSEGGVLVYDSSHEYHSEYKQEMSWYSDSMPPDVEQSEQVFYPALRDYYQSQLDSVEHIQYKIVKQLAKYGVIKQNRYLTVAERDTISRLNELFAILDKEVIKYQDNLSELK